MFSDMMQNPDSPSSLYLRLLKTTIPSIYKVFIAILSIDSFWKIGRGLFRFLFFELIFIVLFHKVPDLKWQYLTA